MIASFCKQIGLIIKLLYGHRNHHLMSMGTVQVPAISAKQLHSDSKILSYAVWPDLSPFGRLFKACGRIFGPFWSSLLGNISFL